MLTAFEWVDCSVGSGSDRDWANETYKQDNHRPRRLVNKMREYLTKNNILTLMALIAFPSGIGFGLVKSYQAMWLMGIISVVFLFFSNLDKISKLKFGRTGFEAETREVVKEARNTIKELQDLSKIMASTTLGLVKRTGRLGGYSYDDKEKIKNETLDVLERLGISDEDIEMVIAESKWHKFTELDYVYHILGANLPPEILGFPKISERQKLLIRDLDHTASPEELTEFLTHVGLLDNEANELIKDYRHYIEFRKQRRPEVWSNRGSWSHLLRKDE